MDEHDEPEDQGTHHVSAPFLLKALLKHIAGFPPEGSTAWWWKIGTSFGLF